jgi:hypothetical protein
MSKRNRNVPVLNEIEMSPLEEVALWGLWKTAVWFSKERWARALRVHGSGSVHRLGHGCSRAQARRSRTSCSYTGFLMP